MQVSWGTALVALASQVLVAWVAVRLALNRFRQEKWWERKYEAYAEILTSLHRLRKSVVVEYEMDSRGREPTEEQKAEWKADFKRGSSDLMRHTDLGDFLISPATVALLKRFGEATDKAATNADYVEYVEARLAATNQCMDGVKVAAKKDLGVSRSWWGRIFHSDPPAP